MPKLHSDCVLHAGAVLQGPELLRLRGQLEVVNREHVTSSQQLATLQQEKLKVDEQLILLTAEKASLKKQLTSTAGDIDMLQVGLGVSVFCVCQPAALSHCSHRPPYL